MDTESEIPPAPGLEVRGLGHGERRRKAREEVAVVLASFAGHALGAHEALSRPDPLPCFLYEATQGKKGMQADNVSAV